MRNPVQYDQQFSYSITIALLFIQGNPIKDLIFPDRYPDAPFMEPIKFIKKNRIFSAF